MCTTVFGVTTNMGYKQFSASPPSPSPASTSSSSTTSRLRWTNATPFTTIKENNFNRWEIQCSFRSRFLPQPFTISRIWSARQVLSEMQKKKTILQNIFFFMPSSLYFCSAHFKISFRLFKICSIFLLNLIVINQNSLKIWMNITKLISRNYFRLPWYLRCMMPMMMVKEERGR